MMYNFWFICQIFAEDGRCLQHLFIGLISRFHFHLLTSYVFFDFLLYYIC